MDNQLINGESRPNKRAYLALFIILGALIVSGAVFISMNFGSKHNLPEVQLEPVKNLNSGEIKELSDKETSKQIPRELILESDGKIIKSYESINSDGKLLAVYEYVSGKTIDKTSADLLKVLKDENWTIIDNIKQPQQIIFTADKDNWRVRLVIKPYPEIGKSSVFISSLQK